MGKSLATPVLDCIVKPVFNTHALDPTILVFIDAVVVQWIYTIKVQNRTFESEDVSSGFTVLMACKVKIKKELESNEIIIEGIKADDKKVI
jgi:hypothetical protein